MNDYQKFAIAYFEAFEGRKLYPSLKSWHWPAVVLALVAVVALLVHMARQSAQGGPISPFETLAMLAPLVIAVLLVDQFKKAAILDAARREFGDGMNALEDCRRAALELITHAPSSKFAAMAKECSDLMALQRAHRFPGQPGIGYFARKIYDPDSKARLLTIGMGCIALVTAMIVHSLPEDTPTLLEVFASGDFWKAEFGALCAVAVLFLILLCFQATAMASFSAMSMWWTKLTGHSTSSNVAIRYFLRDLVLLHRHAHGESTLDLRTDPIGLAGMKAPTPTRLQAGQKVELESLEN